MSPYLRKVKTASGATAVQIVEKRNGRRRIVEHIGSAHELSYTLLDGMSERTLLVKWAFSRSL